jgi:Right handed beta helix region
MKKLISILLLASSVYSRAAVITYYVSTTGSSGNSGLTTNAPWPLAYALANAGASNIVSLLPGTYGVIDLGTPATQSGLTVKSYFKWQAKLVGTAGNHVFATETGVSNVVVDGLQIANSWIDGIKFNSHGCTARNNWVYGAGKGNPAWVTNTDSSFTGQGIASHNYYGTVIENNLLENNGAWIDHDHGVYANGTNLVIRGNVMRGNLAHGIQIYENAPQAAADILIYNNLIYGNGRGIVCYSQTNSTNYIYGNTIVSPVASVNSTPILVRDRNGYVKATNNICIGNGYSIGTDDTGKFYEDYNILSSQASFVNTNTGLFWIKVTSNAKGAALSTIYGAVDFFGNTQSSVADIGAFQYSSYQEADTRTLDPSGSTGADYWHQLALDNTGNIFTVGTLTIGP